MFVSSKLPNRARSLNAVSRTNSARWVLVIAVSFRFLRGIPQLWSIGIQRPDR